MSDTSSNAYRLEADAKRLEADRLYAEADELVAKGEELEKQEASNDNVVAPVIEQPTATADSVDSSEADSAKDKKKK